MKMSAVDFTIHAHPVLAVACPACQAKPGSWCKRPSEHKASDFHKDRKQEADRRFIAQHGEDASIDRGKDRWIINPTGRRDAWDKEDREN